MKTGILMEPDFDRRVALLPQAVKVLKENKVDVLVEKNAGVKAFAPDSHYEEAGARIASRDEVISDADVLLSINKPPQDTLDKLKSGQVYICIFNPLINKEIINFFKQKNLTAFSMDLIPRTSRGQSMDVLSSMATVSGYKAVLDAATRLRGFFPMFMSAAGTIKPAKVLILGAGVAGLQAIATARRLGAVVEVFDVRSAVKEQVESLGGKFVEVEGAEEDTSAGGYAIEQTKEFKEKQKALVHEHAVKSDVVITTAQIPGKKAPLLIEEHTVKEMAKGSVIIDLAASSGGNCELTENGQTVVKSGITIVGNSAYPSDMPTDASRMYGNNLLNFMKLIIDDEGGLKVDLEDDIIRATCMVHEQEIISERLKNMEGSS